VAAALAASGIEGASDLFLEIYLEIRRCVAFKGRDERAKQGKAPEEKEKVSVDRITEFFPNGSFRAVDGTEISKEDMPEAIRVQMAIYHFLCEKVGPDEALDILADLSAGIAASSQVQEPGPTPKNIGEAFVHRFAEHFELQMKLRTTDKETAS
jgi:hypothetical protein